MPPGLIGLVAVAAIAAMPFFRGPPKVNVPVIGPGAPGQPLLVIKADQGPAEVYVNGQLMGRLEKPDQPLELSVDPGSYFVQVKGEGFKPFEQQVKVAPNRGRR